MPPAGHIIQHTLKPAPVIDDGAVGLAALHHLAGQTVRKLQLNRLSVISMAPARFFWPQHQSRHGLGMSDGALQRHRPPRLGPAGRRSHAQQQGQQHYINIHDAKIQKSVYIVAISAKNPPVSPRILYV